eukprot:NODE_4903_length_724_cov_22.641541_g4740_i0.p1 GENE.NODE_4903_length_724_cov_22.641541_g4740_i0~~NODE_4903_length_724_cov_22.641541_g4740_i0.p1  ORF type:complete len:201 (+),score=52.90 NODE_4903_length_724_cov_22.641541_g4740_i0:57-659(+)
MSAKPKKFKLVLLGEAGVGKSSIVLRLIKDEYVEYQHSTVGASFFRHSVPLAEQTLHFDIWDTAGQERYKSLASMYYRGAAAALVVYDITSMESFERAKFWVKELHQGGDGNLVIALTGNKCDLVDQRKVSEEMAERYAMENGLICLETSAKTAINIHEVFAAIAHKLVDNVAQTAQTVPAVGFNLAEGNRSKPRQKCCA